MNTCFRSKIILDSVTKYGDRLITLEATYPRIIHSELMTHRVMSRNAASSRAIPVQKMLDAVKNSPFIPSEWPKNKPGMQATEFIENPNAAREGWMIASRDACKSAEWLLEQGVHKQIANRLLEPFSWITVIITSTCWDNFFNLRENTAAQPEFQSIAGMMHDAINNSTPTLLEFDEWHTPYIQADEMDLAPEDRLKISVARCARVSYLTHDGKKDVQSDINLFNRLLSEKHMSPFEHVARPKRKSENNRYLSNFNGWVQYRKLIPDESLKDGKYQKALIL